MTKMKPEIKRRWIEALRSGKYKQTQNFLFDEAGGMCCLGVLSDILFPNAWEGDEGEIKSIFGRDQLPPEQVCEAAGLDYAEGGEMDADKPIVQLAGMNDGGADFLAIADRIEREL